MDNTFTSAEDDSLDNTVPLFEKVVAGQLTEEERVRLESALRESANARKEFRNYVALHIELAGAVRLARSRQLVYDEIRRKGRESTSRSAPTLVTTETVSITTQNNRNAWWGIGLAATLAAAICVPLFVWQGQPVSVVNGPDEVELNLTTFSKPPAPVATLIASVNAQWKGNSLEQGHTLREGEGFELLAGQIQVSVGCGAEIVTNGPCSLVFESRNRVRLSEGEVAVHVAKWGQGFTVTTDTMEVVDLGTTFTVAASVANEDVTRVLSGLVRVHPNTPDNQERRGLLVSEGESLAIDRHTRKLHLQAAQSKWPAFRQLTGIAPYRPVSLHNTGLGLSIGDEDPNWTVVSGPIVKGPVFATVCKPHHRYLANDRNTSQWVSITDWERAEVDAVYTFRSTFSLDGYDLSTIHFFGRFLADNGVREVRVNGSLVNVESWNDDQFSLHFDHDKFRFVDVTDALIAGENVVEVDVYNSPYVQGKRDSHQQPNPMALRVEWFAFARDLPLAAASDSPSWPPVEASENATSPAE